jgi:hypothetical protein
VDIILEFSAPRRSVSRRRVALSHSLRFKPVDWPRVLSSLLTRCAAAVTSTPYSAAELLPCNEQIDARALSTFRGFMSNTGQPPLACRSLKKVGFVSKHGSRRRPAHVSLALKMGHSGQAGMSVSCHKRISSGHCGWLPGTDIGAATPHLDEAADEIGDTLFLTLRAGLDTVCVARRLGAIRSRCWCSAPA